MSKEVQNDADVKSALRQIFGEDISPEKIKFLDPCCGSGTFLTVMIEYVIR